jgi:hypothetical protein
MDPTVLTGVDLPEAELRLYLVARTAAPAEMATKLVVTATKIYRIHIFRSQTPAMVCLPEDEITVAVVVSHVPLPQLSVSRLFLQPFSHVVSFPLILLLQKFLEMIF